MITVENLTFSYQKQKQTLHGLTFSVADGEIFGFLGPNGSGKSTTQKILTGILRGYGGSTCLFGEPLENQQKNFQEKIGVLFEFPYLYTNLSAIDNLNYFASFYPSERRRDVNELLTMLEFKKDFINKPVSSYSKGMRQRVSMARALLNSPEPKKLKEKNSNHQVEIETLYQGKRRLTIIETPELKAGIPFPYDEIISIHSKEPTLEDMFIQYTGRGLA